MESKDIEALYRVVGSLPTGLLVRFHDFDWQLFCSLSGSGYGSLGLCVLSGVIANVLRSRREDIL